MIRFTAIQELIDGGYKLHANCHNWHCQHNQQLDLVKLRERLGPDHSILHDDLVPKLKCSICRGQEGLADPVAAFGLDGLHQIEGSVRWFPLMDSNHDSRRQRAVSYR